MRRLPPMDDGLSPANAERPAPPRPQARTHGLSRRPGAAPTSVTRRCSSPQPGFSLLRGAGRCVPPATARKHKPGRTRQSPFGATARARRGGCCCCCRPDSGIHWRGRAAGSRGWLGRKARGRANPSVFSFRVRLDLDIGIGEIELGSIPKQSWY